MDKDERKRELPRFDGRLRDAVTDDMAAYVGEVMSSVAFRGGLRGRQDPAAPSEGARGVEGGGSRARRPRQAQGEYALRMAAQERILHLLFAHRGGRKDPRRTPVQAGGTALAPPQRRMGLRHHRQTALRSMRAAAMDDYFFNGKNRTQSKYAGRAGMARRHPGPVDKGRLLRPTCAKNEGFAIRATLANLSTVTLATLRPVQPVGECYSVASLTVCECPKIPSTHNTRQLVHC